MKLSTILILASLFFTTAAKAATDQGLTYSYYEGNWQAMPNFNSLTAVKTGASANADLSVRNRDLNYAILWQGYITIPANGVYTFETNSDDASMLYTGQSATPLVNNDGLHADQLRSGSLYLAAGVYPVSISFMQYGGGQTMELFWSSNTGISRQRIPDNAFSYSSGATLKTTATGLGYSYYEGSWSVMPDFNTLTTVKTGTSSNTDLGVRNRDINYAILWKGYITIPADGTYTFETNSDDGSMLYIGQTATALVNNDGLHADQLRSGTLYLASGVYPVTTSFFQNGGGQTMELYWSSNTGISRQRIPDNAFSSQAPPAVPVSATGTASGLDYAYYEGSWSVMPDFNSLTAVKTGSCTNADLGVRNRDINYAILWKGYITIPANGTYTFETNSDDGSMIFIGQNATALVNNDGLHADQLRSGSIYLAAGSYPVSMSFFQNGGGQTMEIYWSSNNGASRQRIPDNAFSHNVKTPDVSTETGGLTGAVNYYFSASTGNDAYSAAQAQNQATPWKSLAKLNAVLAASAPGTAFLLKRGDVFDGAINVAASGAPAKPLVISAYGTGSKPVINGFASAPAWTPTGNGIWEAPLNTSISKLNMVAKDNQIQQMGRYPNITDDNRGFLSLDAHSNPSSGRATVDALYSYLNADGSTSIQSITDFQLPAFPNWTGAEVVIKKNRWVIDRGLITAHSGNTLSYVEPSGMQPIDGFGYFIQNDPRTLDQTGEWYFNTATRKIQVYSGAASPAAYAIRPSVVDTLVTIRSRSYITLDNIAMQGANSFALAVWDNANFVSVQNCSIDFSGINGITANFLQAFSLSNSIVNHTNNNAMYLAPGCWNASIKGNTIKNSGLIAGMGLSNNQAHEGIIIDGRGALLQYNTVDSIGYVGIAITRDSVTVINNLVTNFALTTDDCGGIYTHDGGYYGRRILNNIVLGGHGCHYGTNTTEDSDAQGIGLDDMSNFVEISGNTVANCSGRGIGLHNSQNITITGNTAFNNKTAQVEFDHDMLGAESPTRNVTLSNNILVSKTAAQPVFNIISKNDDIALFGTATANYYCRPVDDQLTFGTIALWGSAQANTQQYDLAHWKGVANQDGSSKKSPLTLSPYTVTASGANMIANGAFNTTLAGTMNPGADHTSLQYDNTVLDGGALKVSYSGAQNSASKGLMVWFYDPANLQTLVAGHTYRLRFSIKGSQDNNTDFVAVAHSSTTGTSSDMQPFKVYGSRKEVELIYTPSVSVPAYYLNIYTQNADKCPVWWLDNVRMEEVTLSYTNPDDYLRLEYNATTANKTIALDAVYVDMKGSVYAYSVTLAPYSSVVLMKSAAAGVIQAQAQSTAAAAAAVPELKQSAASAVGVKVSPNPATDRLELTHSLQVGSGAQPATVTLYNAGAAVVRTLSVQLTSHPVSIPVAGLAPGVYTIKLDCAKGSNTARFVKL